MLLSLIHGITPDQHTWPIVFSYAIAGYSTWRGLRAGLIFALAFTVQQSLVSQLDYFGLVHWFTSESLHHVVDLIVRPLMIAAGLYVIGRGGLHHLHLAGMVSVLAGCGNSAVSARRVECPSTWSPARA